MRKVLVPALCATVAAAPAVAFAATDDNDSNTQLAAATSVPSHVLRADAKQKLRTAVKRARQERKQRLQAKAQQSTASPQLEAIAACESGGDPSAIGGGGTYRGKYQFDYGTWASVGGSGDPAAAPEAEQDKRAAILLQRAGTSPWPVCGS